MPPETTAVAGSSNLWILVVVRAGLSWGMYVPTVFFGGTELKSPTGNVGGRLTSILCVGVAYFVLAVVIPVLLICAVSSLLGHGPFKADEGMRWYSLKIMIFSGLLVIGLKLRFIMREWTILFRRLAEPGEHPQEEAQLERSIRVGRSLAYLYWVGIWTVAFLGAVKPL